MPVRIAIIGLGYWGPNWLRNFASIDACDVVLACDLSEERCAKWRRVYPATHFTTKHEEVFASDADAVVIATPPSTHFMLAKRALEAGKHVLIEKPMTTNAKDAQKLIDLAATKKRILLVDHTFVFTSAVERMRTMAEKKELGTLLYFDSTRINLGLIQKDANVLWDLAIHDLSILSAIHDLHGVTEVFAHGSKHFGKQVEVAHLHLTFRDGFDAHVHVSWLSPVKIRSTLLGGTKSMVVYDDTEPSEKIRVYDKGVDRDETHADPFFPKYRSGDVLIPALENAEALQKIALHFLRCIAGKEKPRVSGEDGRAMVRILELADQSMEKNKPVAITTL